MTSYIYKTAMGVSHYDKYNCEMNFPQATGEDCRPGILRIVIYESAKISPIPGDFLLQQDDSVKDH
jgi:hypothetical protein